MKTVNVRDLNGQALNYAVNLVEENCDDPAPPPYSSSWAWAGPIIETQKLDAFWNSEADWWSVSGWDKRGAREVVMRDPHYLTAAMRCYVASKLGDEVDLPGGLARSKARRRLSATTSRPTSSVTLCARRGTASTSTCAPSNRRA